MVSMVTNIPVEVVATRPIFLDSFEVTTDIETILKDELSKAGVERGLNESESLFAFEYLKTEAGFAFPSGPKWKS